MMDEGRCVTASVGVSMVVDLSCNVLESFSRQAYLVLFMHPSQPGILHASTDM
jgi:hypothetical protein